MSFAHPSQHQHKFAGMAAAAKSPNTPAHLRPHLQKKAGIGMAKIGIPKSAGKIPQKQVLKSTNPAQVAEEQPMDTQPFTTSSNDMAMMGAGMGKVTKAPPAAGSRPMNVTASLPKRTGPGIVQSQGAVSKPNQGRTGPGITHGFGLNRPNSSRNVPKVTSVVRKGERGPGLQKMATQQKTRHMRGVAANPNFYSDFT